MAFSANAGKTTGIFGAFFIISFLIKRFRCISQYYIVQINKLFEFPRDLLNAEDLHRFNFQSSVDFLSRSLWRVE